MLWLLDFAWPGPRSAASAEQSATLWRSVDGALGRCYLEAATEPGPEWTALEHRQTIGGASQGEAALYHYAVETDVAPEHEHDFNAWYAQEHLAGLAAVPGTVRAARYCRVGGAPRYLACYDLTSPQVLERAEWQAVRHSAWSSRIRPLFLNPRRTLFARG
jgi:hypothetical protein